MKIGKTVGLNEISIEVLLIVNKMTSDWRTNLILVCKQVKASQVSLLSL